MNSVNSSFIKINNSDIILGIILLLYIFGGYQTPTQLSPYINNFISYTIMIILVSMTLGKSNIVVGLLLGISFIILIKRSNETHPSNVMPSQTYRDTVMNNLNSKNTFNSNNYVPSQQLEEYIVSNMSTINYQFEDLDNDSFKPTMSTKPGVFELN